MSFLYKALLKNNQSQGAPAQSQQPVEQKPQPHVNYQAQGNPSVFAGQQFVESPKQGVPSYFWVILAVCLLVIGLLAGYIFGQSFTTPSEVKYVAVPTVQSVVETREVVEAETTSAPAPLEQIEPVENKTTVQPEEFEPEQKVVTVSVDKDGKVESKVEAKIESKTDAESNVQDFQESEPQQEPAIQTTKFETSEVEDVPAISELPEDLVSQFEMAVKATEDFSDEIDPEQTESVQTSSSLMDISELPLTEKSFIPDLTYQMHIFASDKAERWVRINGKTLIEGQAFSPKLTLVEIRQDYVVWENQYSRFSQQALVDFKR